jgi:hypothetical protein
MLLFLTVLLHLIPPFSLLPFFALKTDNCLKKVFGKTRPR